MMRFNFVTLKAKNKLTLRFYFCLFVCFCFAMYTQYKNFRKVSKTGLRCIVKKESKTVQNKLGNGRKPKIWKTLVRKIVRDVSKALRKLSRHYYSNNYSNGLCQVRIVVSRKQSPCTGMDCDEMTCS